MTLPEIQNHIELIKSQLQILPEFSLAQIEGQIQHHAARAIVGADASRHKAALEAAIIQKGEVERSQEQRARLNKELQQLRTALAIEEAEQARLKHEQEQRQKDELLHEYQRCALAMVRAARKCMRANINTGDFSVGFLSSDPNSGFSLRDEMRFGPLRFERREQEQGQG
jgi:hypothetical protein